MNRAALAFLAVTLAAACGRDDQLSVYLVFPDASSQSKAKSVYFQIFSAGTSSCESLPTGSAAYQYTLNSAPPSPGATPTPIGRTAIPDGAILVVATVYDAPNGGGNVVVFGCTPTESGSTNPSRNNDVVIELHR